jgi:hypothetical protein
MALFDVSNVYPYTAADQFISEFENKYLELLEQGLKDGNAQFKFKHFSLEGNEITTPRARWCKVNEIGKVYRESADKVKLYAKRYGDRLDGTVKVVGRANLTATEYSVGSIPELLRSIYVPFGFEVTLTRFNQENARIPGETRGNLDGNDLFWEDSGGGRLRWSDVASKPSLAVENTGNRRTLGWVRIDNSFHRNIVAGMEFTSAGNRYTLIMDKNQQRFPLVIRGGQFSIDVSTTGRIFDQFVYRLHNNRPAIYTTFNRDNANGKVFSRSGKTYLNNLIQNKEHLSFQIDIQWVNTPEYVTSFINSYLIHFTRPDVMSDVSMSMQHFLDNTYPKGSIQIETLRGHAETILAIYNRDKANGYRHVLNFCSDTDNLFSTDTSVCYNSTGNEIMMLSDSDNVSYSRIVRDACADPARLETTFNDIASPERRVCGCMQPVADIEAFKEKYAPTARGGPDCYYPLCSQREQLRPSGREYDCAFTQINQTCIQDIQLSTQGDVENLNVASNCYQQLNNNTEDGGTRDEQLNGGSSDNQGSDTSTAFWENVFPKPTPTSKDETEEESGLTTAEMIGLGVAGAVVLGVVLFLVFRPPPAPREKLA